MKKHARKRLGSLDSTSSVASTSSQRLGHGVTGLSGHEYATTASVTTSYGRYLNDIVAAVIHCPKHQKFALVQCAHHSGLWLPHVALRQSEGWYAAIVKKLRQLLGVKLGTKSSTVFTSPEIMHVMRIQLPEVLKYVTRVVFMTNLRTVTTSSPSEANNALHKLNQSSHGQPLSASSPASAKSANGNEHFKCFCDHKQPHNGMKWLKHDSISNDEEALDIWGPEPGIFTSAFATKTVERGAYSEYTLREAIKFQPSDSPKTFQEEMLKSCRFERNDILRLYSDYVQHCYPAQNMNFVSFKDYMLKIGFENSPEPPHSPHSSSKTNIDEYFDLNSHRTQQKSHSSAHSPHHDGKDGATSSPKETSVGNGHKSHRSVNNSSHSHELAPSYVSPNHLHDIRSLYRAFKFQKMPYLTFHELMLGLAAMDRNTAHGGHSGQLRCSYIFRYFDSNSDGHLTFNDIRAMAIDSLRRESIKAMRVDMTKTVKKDQTEQSTGSKATNATQTSSQDPSSPTKDSNNNNNNGNNNNTNNNNNEANTKQAVTSNKATAAGQKIDKLSLAKEIERIYTSLKIKIGEQVSELAFLMSVGTMTLRGTSILFRAQFSVVPVKQHYEIIKEKLALTDIEGNLIGKEAQSKGTCPRCREKVYSLALHTVKLTHDAQIVEPTEVRFDEYPAPISRAQRQLSRLTFASDTTPNKLMDMIITYWNAVALSNIQAGFTAAGAAAGTSSNRSDGTGGGSGGSGPVNLPIRLYTATANAVELGKTSWERIDRQQLAQEVQKICTQAEAIFKKEARIVGVTSPCIVLGDIHGNLNDLRIYERTLWPHAPTCVTGSYLFLGDYVDRGDYGLECIVYLLSMKILAPKTFFLLRGNHELRSIQQAFTFFREVCEKFKNQQLGIQVWESLNKTFDSMPIAATIDDQIFCAHGGIPTSLIRLEELVNIPTPLPDPENQSPAAWEILWNDPVSSTEYTEYADLLRKQPGGQQAVANMQGYLPNTKRGTAFFFSEESVKRFLSINNLSHVIRAHECVPPGYSMLCNGKVLTIFSSSRYCGATNDAACVLVEREKIRIIRLETD